MSRIIKFFRVLRRNPKKSIFFSGVFAAGINYGNTKIEENNMMRKFCEEAMVFGEYPKPLGDQERHITVLLNPSAKDGKGKKLFEKYCAPLLHLAGIKVATVKTEHQGQAQDLMGIMDNTSAVIVAGGDGTLAEVLTGLLRRSDHKDAARRFPLGVLPLGHTNTATSAIWGFRGNPTPRHLAEATMAIIHDIKRPLDVMEITPLQESALQSGNKPVYAASMMEWGAYRDAAERKEKYWYWFLLKKYMTYIFSSYKSYLTWDCSSEVEYSLPCSGCSRCCAEDSQEAAANDIPEPPRRWWMAFIPKTRPMLTQEEEEEEKIDYSNIVNEECGVVHRTSINNISDLSIFTQNTPDSLEVPGHALSLRTGPVNVGAFSFIKEGWNREWNKTRTYAAESVVGDLTLQPTGETKTKEGADRELNIDSETFEVRPMRIRPRPKAVTVFAPTTPPYTANIG